MMTCIYYHDKHTLILVLSLPKSNILQCHLSWKSVECIKAIGKTIVYGTLTCVLCRLGGVPVLEVHCIHDCLPPYRYAGYRYSEYKRRKQEFLELWSTESYEMHKNYYYKIMKIVNFNLCGYNMLFQLHCCGIVFTCIIVSDHTQFSISHAVLYIDLY